MVLVTRVLWMVSNVTQVKNALIKNVSVEMVSCSMAIFVKVRTTIIVKLIDGNACGN